MFYNENNLYGILLSIFDQKIGPKLMTCIPNNIITKELYTKINNFIIPKEGLQEKLITIKLHDLDYFLSGIAVSIYNEEMYKRKVLEFNVSILYRCEGNRQKIAYENIIRNLVISIVNLENDVSLLSKSFFNEDIGIKIKYETDIKHIDDILNDFQNQLTTSNFVIIPINEHNIITLSLDQSKEKIFENDEYMQTIENQQVPVLMLDPETVIFDDKLYENKKSLNMNFANLSNSDIILPIVIRGINGIYHVKKLAEFLDIHINLLKMALKNLQYYGLVKFIDIFSFNNTYQLNYGVKQLCLDKNLQKECIDACSVGQKNKISLKFILKLLKQLSGKSIKEFILENQNLLIQELDIRRLICFCIVNNILIRSHQYAILQPNENNNYIENVQLSIKKYFNPDVDPRRFVSMLDGKHCFDEICCEHKLKATYVFEIINDIDTCIIFNSI